MRERRREKYLNAISLIMGRRGLKEADRAAVIEAVKMMENRGLDPTFDSWDDPDSFRKKVLDPMTDLAAYEALPVRVNRWPHPPYFAEKPPKDTKVLAFCASPRSGGNTDCLVDEALRGAAEAGAACEKVMIQKLKPGFCIGCRKCKEPDFRDYCAIKDGMIAVYPKIVAADAIIVGFPVYTGRECAQLSTFLDRWDCFERYNYATMLKPGRRAMVIGTWGYPGIETYDFVMERIMILLNLHKVATVEAVAACGFEGMLHGFDRERKAVILKHPDQLAKAREAGKALVLGDPIGTP